VGIPQVIGGGPHALQTWSHGHGSAIYDHLRRRHIRWMVMAHHVSHYERHFHLQTMHFQFGVIKAICNLR
jgi:hypothetical protein